MQEWQYSTFHNCTCKVLEEQALWGQIICRVWLPSSDAVVKVPNDSLKSIFADLNPETEKARISYVASAAKVADALENSSSREEGHVLLAPMDSKVIPLPHQIHALSRAVSTDRVRYLLADEVGLGKTIEAGLILRELKLRGLVRRTLVVSPKGIATQWVSEMQAHFNEKFQMILGEDLKTLHRISATPHQGKTDAFHRLISLLDETAFPDMESVTKERVSPFVIRTEKQRALDATGKPLFKPPTDSNVSGLLGNSASSSKTFV